MRVNRPPADPESGYLGGSTRIVGRDRARPNRAIALLWTGAAVLALGLICAGVGLIAGAA